MNSVFQKIKKQRINVSSNIFSQISGSLFSNLIKLQTVLTSIMSAPSGCLFDYLTDATFNTPHLTVLISFSAMVDQLCLNCYLSIPTKVLQSNDTYKQVCYSLFMKSMMLNDLYKQILNDPSSYDSELTEAIEENAKVLTYEFSILQKYAPLLFSSFFNEYFEYVLNMFFENWSSEDLNKSSAFMLLKVLTTFPFYTGK